MTPKQMWKAALTQLPLLVGLVLLWCVLWGRLDVMTVVTGIGLAVFVTRIFYLPPVRLSGRFNPWFALVLVVRLLVDIVVASFSVGWRAVFGPRAPHSAIIEIELCTRDDLLITVVAEAVSVVPGSIVVEVDRDHGRLFLHVLGGGDAAAVDHARRTVHRVEKMVLKAAGTRAELAAAVAQSDAAAREEVR